MIIGFDRVVLMCKDTDATRAWYEKAGFPYLRGFGGMHWLSLGDSEVMLHPAEGPVVASASSIHALVQDADIMFAKVRAAGLDPHDHQQPGVRLEGPVTREWGDREFDLTDPDGQRWAFTER